MEAVSIPPRIIYPYTPQPQIESYRPPVQVELLSKTDNHPTLILQKWKKPIQTRTRNQRQRQRQHDQTFKHSQNFKRRKEQFPSRAVNQPLNYDDKFQNSIFGLRDSPPLSKNEIQTSKILSSLLAVLGMSGLFLPMFALLSLPMDLMSPNLFLAKSLALLSIPVAVLSYGKKRRKRSLNELELELGPDFFQMLDHLAQNFENIVTKGKNKRRKRQRRSLMIIRRIPELINLRTTTPTTTTTTTSTSDTEDDQYDEETPRPSRSTTIPPPAKMQIDKPQGQREQCLERIACEGLLNSLPQLFIRSVLRGKEQMVRNLMGTYSPSVLEKEMGGRSIDPGPSPSTFKMNRLPRRKNLAKYALGKISGGNNNKVANTGSFVDTLYENSAIKIPVALPITISSAGAGVGSGGGGGQQNYRGCSQYKCSMMW